MDQKQSVSRLIKFILVRHHAFPAISELSLSSHIFSVRVWDDRHITNMLYFKERERLLTCSLVKFCTNALYDENCFGYLYLNII